MGIAVLGPLSVDNVGALVPRDRVVLAALALRPGEVVSAERLADALWAEGPPASWPKVIQGCVVRLRKALGAAAIETTRHGYRLVMPADEVDAQRFERLVARCRELLTLGEPERAAHVIGEALALWRGRALVDLKSWDPGRVEGERLEELRRDAEELILDAALQAGRHRAVLAEAQARVAEAPLRERRWALLALAQYQAGRQGEALRTLHRARTVLATELGLDPGPDLVDLESAILRQDPSLVARVAPPEPSATCPYLGLVPYDVGDADGFFGRDADVAACLRRLAAVGVLAVVGPSGSGKSSLVRAGVAAALERDGRRVLVITPGAHPMDALTALPDRGPAPVLVVDQCEEAVALCDDTGEQARFFGALAAHARCGPLVVALRADRLGELSAHPVFARLIEPGLYLLGAMSETDLRAAIEGPARQAGLLLEPGLVELLVREVEGEPGALPLLSHALRTTWQRREGRTLTVAGYRDTGGIRGAVAQSAEELYGQVPPDQQPLLRDLLLRLVAPSPEGEPVRGRVPRRLVATDPAHERLVELLVAARLVTTDDGVVELAHEALARAWPRLQSWLDDDIEGQRILRHLTLAADTWEAMGRPDSELYRGVRLAQALDWRQHTEPDLTATEQAFLDAGETLADTERQAAEVRARRQARQNRRLRVLLACVAVLLAVALVAGLVAVRQRDRAQESATVAEAQRLGNQALSVEYLDQSLLLAVEGRRLHDSNDARADLLAALTRSPQAARIVRSIETRPQDLIVTSDGRYIAMRDNTGGVFFFDATTLERVAEVVDQMAFVDALAPLPGGRGVAAMIRSTDTGEAAIRFFDPATGRESRDRLEGVVPPVASMDISDDGRYLAAATGFGDHGPAFETVWDLDAPMAPPRRLDHGLDRPSVAFTPDGRLLIASVGFVPGVGVTVVDPATGAVLRTDPEAHAPIAVSPDGATLVAAVGDESRPELAVIDMATGSQRQRLTGHTGLITSVAFSPDGSSFASASRDAKVMIWSPSTGERTATLEGHNGWVNGVDYAADGSTLYSASLDGVMIAWDLAGDRRFLRQLAPPSRPRCAYLAACPTSVTASPDGTRLSYRYADLGVDTLAVRDLATLRFGTETPSEHVTMSETAWTPDGRHIVTVGEDKMIRLWDPVTGRKLAEQPLLLDSTSTSIASRPGDDAIYIGLQIGHKPGPHPAGAAGGHDAGAVVRLDPDTLQPMDDPMPVDRYVAKVDVSPDGRVYAVALDYTPALQLVDSETGDVLAAFDGLDATYQLAFSPDGSLLAAGGRDGNLTLIDPATRRRVGPTVRAVDGTVVSLDFSPDGTRIVTGGSDGTLALWDTATSERIGRIPLGSRNAGVFTWFDDDGRTIVAADQLGGIWTFPSEPDEWERHACETAGRNLTRDEWREFIPDRPYHRTCPEHHAST